jgi:hypothetical protein
LTAFVSASLATKYAAASIDSAKRSFVAATSVFSGARDAS